MKNTCVLTSLALICLFAVSVVSAGEQSTANSQATSSMAGEQIKWQVISGGGNSSNSTNFKMSATVGQTAVGMVVSTGYKLNQGFWQNFSASGSCCVSYSVDGRTGNVDGDPLKGVDISDLSALIDFLYISFTPPACIQSANTDGDVSGGVDIADLTALIDYLYISFTPPAACQ